MVLSSARSARPRKEALMRKVITSRFPGRLYEWEGDAPPTLEEAQAALDDAYIAIVELANGDQLLCDENGALMELAPNWAATEYLREVDPTRLASFGGVVVGPVLILRGKTRWED